MCSQIRASFVRKSFWTTAAIHETCCSQPMRTGRCRATIPSAGYVLTVYLSIGEAGVIKNAAFVGKGCVISMASVWLMAKILKGSTAGEVERLSDTFHHMCTRAELECKQETNTDALWRLSVLASVREFPIGIKCATLAWSSTMVSPSMTPMHSRMFR